MESKLTGNKVRRRRKWIDYDGQMGAIMSEENRFEHDWVL